MGEDSPEALAAYEVSALPNDLDLLLICRQFTVGLDISGAEDEPLAGVPVQVSMIHEQAVVCPHLGSEGVMGHHGLSITHVARRQHSDHVFR